MPINIKIGKPDSGPGGMVITGNKVQEKPENKLIGIFDYKKMRTTNLRNSERRYFSYYILEEEKEEEDEITKKQYLAKYPPEKKSGIYMHIKSEDNFEMGIEDLNPNFKNEEFINIDDLEITEEEKIEIEQLKDGIIEGEEIYTTEEPQRTEVLCLDGDVTSESGAEVTIKGCDKEELELVWLSVNYDPGLGLVYIDSKADPSKECVVELDKETNFANVENFEEWLFVARLKNAHLKSNVKWEFWWNGHLINDVRKDSGSRIVGPPETGIQTEENVARSPCVNLIGNQVVTVNPRISFPSGLVIGGENDQNTIQTNLIYNMSQKFVPIELGSLAILAITPENEFTMDEFGPYDLSNREDLKTVSDKYLFEYEEKRDTNGNFLGVKPRVQCLYVHFVYNKASDPDNVEPFEYYKGRVIGSYSSAR